jgi:8-oxo-dGTP pyrophosphatase MutT (NUDIX family)
MSKLKKWELLEEKDISPSKWFPLALRKYKLPNERIIDDFYIYKQGKGVMVLAITKNKEIVFVRQYKPGVDDIVLELPAGLVEDKSIEENAKRELMEETGIVAEGLELLGNLYQCPTKNNFVCHCFITNNAEINSEPEPDENEEIEVVLIPINEVEKMIAENKIKCSDTLACLYIAKIKYPVIFNS